MGAQEKEQICCWNQTTGGGFASSTLAVGSLGLPWAPLGSLRPRGFLNEFNLECPLSYRESIASLDWARLENAPEKAFYRNRTSVSLRVPVGTVWC